MNIKIAETESDFIKCFEAMKALRQHLTFASFLSLIEEMRKETYSLIYIEENQMAVSVCGFRYLTTLLKVGIFILMTFRRFLMLEEKDMLENYSIM